MPVPPKPRRPDLTEDVQLDMLALLAFLRQIPKRGKPAEVRNAEDWLEDLAEWRCELEEWEELHG